MKYSVETIIDKPIDEVLEKFEDKASYSKWQKGFISLELIEGEEKAIGSKYRLKYDMGKRKVEMIETLKVYDLPREFTATYEAKGVWNEVKNYFEPTEDGKTRYRTDNEFQMKGAMKIIQWLMPGAFKKQSQIYLDHFKTFVETGESAF